MSPAFIRDQLLAHAAVIDVKSSFALERIKERRRCQWWFEGA